MDLSLSRRADYAVRAALALAKNTPAGSYKKIREVAVEMELPASYTPHILNLLLKAGIAEARAGQQGGYRLGRPPEKVSLLDVVEAAEGPLRMDHCTLSGGPCHWENMCALHPIWDEARAGLVRVLSERSLASLVSVDAGLEAGTYKVPETSHRRSAHRTSAK